MVSTTNTFTITHARHMAAKVAADSSACNASMAPRAMRILLDYETEVVELLKAGYLDTVTYGYKRSDKWIEPTLRYTAKDLAGSSGNDDDPGKVRPNADISGASFYNYLTYSSAWFALTPDQRESFKKGLPFQRTGAAEPGISGYLMPDRTYSAGGKALDRFSVRSY